MLIIYYPAQERRVSTIVWTYQTWINMNEIHHKKIKTCINMNVKNHKKYN